MRSMRRPGWHRMHHFAVGQPAHSLGGAALDPEPLLGAAVLHTPHGLRRAPHPGRRRPREGSDQWKAFHLVAQARCEGGVLGHRTL